MRAKVGLWIDNRKAIVVTVTDKGEEILLTISAAENSSAVQVIHPSRVPMNHSRCLRHDSRQRTLTGHYNLYYDAVIACIGDAESILIFGPGEAKGELKKRLEKRKLGGRIAGVETVDKLTNRQSAVKVRKHFAKNVQQ